MHIAKTIFHILFSVMLSSLAFASILVIIASLTLTNRDTVKTWPVRSGFYDNIVDVGLGQITQEKNGQEVSLDTVIEESALDQQVIFNTISNQFSPEYIESKVDIIFDSVYDWLEGKTNQLKYDISLADKSDELVSALSQEVEKQLVSLPVCNPGQVTPSFDVLGATCLPPGVTPAIGASLLETELTGRDSVLNELRFSDKDIIADRPEDTIDQDGNTNKILRSDIEHLPSYYSYLKNMPLILVSILALLVVLVTVTGQSMLKGLRRAGQTVFSAGLVAWVGFFLTNRFSDSLTLDNFGNAKEAEIANKIIAPLFSTIIKDLSLTGIWVALVMVIAGILIWLTSFIWHKVHHHHEAEEIAKKAAAGIGASHPQLTGTEAKLPEPSEETNEPKVVDTKTDASTSDIKDETQQTHEDEPLK